MHEGVCSIWRKILNRHRGTSMSIENKKLTINVEKTNKLILGIIFLFAFIGAYGVSFVVQTLFAMNDIPEDIIFPVGMLLSCFIILKLDRYIPHNQTIEVNFREESVLISKGTKEHVIQYKDIVEVQKIMVVNHYNDDKGNCRVKIKCKGRNQVFYSTQEEYANKVDFEQTEISKMYFEFKARGVKCC